MGKNAERWVLFIADFLAVNFAWAIFYYIRIESGWFQYSRRPDFWIPMLTIYFYWVIFFSLFGLYKSWYAKSRFDEFTIVFKAITVGVLILFFAIFIDDVAKGTQAFARLIILLYWILMVFIVGGVRLAVRSFQRKLLLKGIGLRNTLIVGWSKKAEEVFDHLKKFPSLGHKVVGFVKTEMSQNDGTYEGISTLGTINQLENLIDQYNIKDIVIALDPSEQSLLLDVLGISSVKNVSFKIIPDIYDIVSGKARSDQLYDVPLIEIMPETMKPWEKTIKRTVDIMLSLFILILGLPLWIIIGLIVFIQSDGSMFDVQTFVGKNEKLFKGLRFRTTPKGISATDDFSKCTPFGKVLRKYHLDLVPFLINVLVGNMSLVGPCPSPPENVRKLMSEVPYYRRVLRVRPGLSGLTKLMFRNLGTADDVKRNLQYDFYYVENMSLRTDFKIFFQSLFSLFRKT